MSTRRLNSGSAGTLHCDISQLGTFKFFFSVWSFLILLQSKLTKQICHHLEPSRPSLWSGLGPWDFKVQTAAPWANGAPGSKHSGPASRWGSSACFTAICWQLRNSTSDSGALCSFLGLDSSVNGYKPFPHSLTALLCCHPLLPHFLPAFFFSNTKVLFCPPYLFYAAVIPLTSDVFLNKTALKSIR